MKGIIILIKRKVYMKKEKKLKRDERIEGIESVHIILYSDDYDNLDNSLYNTKMCLMTFWNGCFCFPGGKIKDPNLSFEDNIALHLMDQLNFNIEPYKDQIQHMNSHYIADNNAMHTYTLKISAKEMSELQLNEPKFDSNGDPLEGSEILMDFCGLSKLNVSLNTINTVIKINFGAGVKESFLDFVDHYIYPKMDEEQKVVDFETKRMQSEREHKFIEEKIAQNPENYLKELEKVLIPRGLGYLIDPTDPRHSSLLDENGLLKDEELNKILLSDEAIFGDLSETKKSVSKIKKAVDFRQTW